MPQRSHPLFKWFVEREFDRADYVHLVSANAAGLLFYHGCYNDSCCAVLPWGCVYTNTLPDGGATWTEVPVSEASGSVILDGTTVDLKAVGEAYSAATGALQGQKEASALTLAAMIVADQARRSNTPVELVIAMLQDLAQKML